MRRPETVEAGKRVDPAAILLPLEGQHDPRQAGRLVEKLQIAGVEVHLASSAFEADGVRYGAGMFIVPMAQVFARYARDILERQTYPEVRLGRRIDMNPSRIVLFARRPRRAQTHATFLMLFNALSLSTTGAGS